MAKDTHKVLDIAVNDDCGVFIGTKKECNDWASEQGFGYQVVPLTEEEYDFFDEEFN